MHPNIVTIHDVGVADGTSDIAMEWVNGSALRDLVAREMPQAIPTVVSIGAQIAEGLSRLATRELQHSSRGSSRAVCRGSPRAGTSPLEISRGIFARVRRDPRFHNALKQMEQALAAMRERSTVLAELRAMPFPAITR
jgi:serine/threonine protein kinase